MNITLRIITAFVVLSIIGLGVGSGVFVAFVQAVKLPPPGQDGLHFENSQILTSNNKLLLNWVDRNQGARILKPLELNPSNRKQCPEGAKTHLSRFYWHHVPYLTCNGHGIPRLLRDATIATEDPTFYSNPGFDVQSILRAAVQDISSGQTQSGASTITEQFVKLFVIKSSAPTLQRKLKEAVTAWKLTSQYPKNYILYDYLNSVFYGDNSNGVQAASENYFHVGVSRLKLWQQAVLAGLPQAPTNDDPFNLSPVSIYGRYPLWYIRMTEVLAFMHERHYISESRVLRAEQEARKYHFYRNVRHEMYPDFVEYVTQQFEDLTNPNSADYDSYLAAKLKGRTLNNGLRIITTLRPRVQRDAQHQVSSQVGGLFEQGYNVSDGALVSMDVRPSCYGCVMAMVGTANVDKKNNDINMALSPRQPGSSFKVFNYVSAFEKGLSPGSQVCDGVLNVPLDTRPVTYYSPYNYDLSFNHGCMKIRQALGMSLNIPAVKTELWNGANTVANTAVKFGISQFHRENPHCCKDIWATTLGGLPGGVTLMQETAAYGAFATNGVKVPPISFTRIVARATGKVLWRYSNDPKLRARRRRVAPQADTFMISSILSDNAARAPEFGEVNNLELNHWAAAKTGTTSSFKDNWTEGYTPQIVTGVWVGNADDAAMYGSSGITGAAPIWQNFMNDAINILHLPDKAVGQPPNVIMSSSCREPNTNEFIESSFPNGPDYENRRRIPYCSVPAMPNLGSYGSSDYYVPPTPTPATQYYYYPAPTPTPVYVEPQVQPTTAPVLTSPQSGTTAGTGTGTGAGTGTGTGTGTGSPPLLSGH